MTEQRTAAIHRSATTDRKHRQLVLDEVKIIRDSAWTVGYELAQPDSRWLLGRDVDRQAVRRTADKLIDRCDAFTSQLPDRIDDRLFALAQLMLAAREFDNLLKIGPVAADEMLRRRRIGRRGSVATQKRYEGERKERCAEFCALYQQWRRENHTGKRLMAKVAEHFDCSVSHSYKILNKQCGGCVSFK